MQVTAAGGTSADTVADDYTYVAVPTITGATVRLSVATDGTEGHDASGDPSVSADGRYVGFLSTRTI